MLTPQDIQSKEFTKAVFGGYDMAAVDDFLEELTENYSALYKDNAVLKGKLKVLVEKVEEYRSTEDAMRKALLTAQRMADDMVAEAEAKRNQMLQSVEAEAKARRNRLRQEVADEEARLSAARKSTAAYIAKLRELYQHEMEFLSGLDKLRAPEEQPDPVAEAAQAIDSAVEQAVKEEAPAAATDNTVTVEVPVEDKSDGGLYAELMELNLNPGEGERHKRPSRQPLEKARVGAGAEEEDDTAPTKRIDFSNLQFGKDYEIK